MQSSQLERALNALAASRAVDALTSVDVRVRFCGAKPTLLRTN
jgi:hypothetical protein